MLTPSMITAENQTPALTDQQELNLQLLVKSSTYYSLAQGIYTDFTVKLADEKATPTVKTQALKAVLTQLDSLPAEVVEAQGRTDSPTFLATRENWNNLALDVLLVFYDNPAMLGLQTWAIAQREVEKLTLFENPARALSQFRTGRRY